MNFSSGKVFSINHLLEFSNRHLSIIGISKTLNCIRQNFLILFLVKENFSFRTLYYRAKMYDPIGGSYANAGRALRRCVLSHISSSLEKKQSGKLLVKNHIFFLFGFYKYTHV